MFGQRKTNYLFENLLCFFYIQTDVIDSGGARGFLETVGL